MQTFLLYSKYADGLLIEHFAENLFRESIKLRNYIVHNEMRLGDGAIGEIVDSLSTDLLNELQIGGKLWNDLPGTATADGHQYAETLYTAGAGLLQPFFHVHIKGTDSQQDRRKQRCVSRICRQLAYPAARKTGGGQYPDRTDHPGETKQVRQRIRPH